jgi:ADP-ribose pyrophosphatase YjhB (NUDIX family)
MSSFTDSFFLTKNINKNINKHKHNCNNCNNCGKPGHLFHQCKMPITSSGIIVFRILPNSSSNTSLRKGSFATPGVRLAPNSEERSSVELEPNIQYLLICRKDTLGYIDFIRGKYSIYNKNYIINMIKQMTNTEKQNLCLYDFDTLWKNIWGDTLNNQYKTEEIVSREKHKTLLNGVKNKSEYYTLQSLIEESNQYQCWDEPEWGFPKGRRNNQETDYDCAIREFSEETGYSTESLVYIQNILPFEEIFTGSNYKSYKHKYFLMYMNYENSIITQGSFQTSEVSKVEWKNYDESISVFRPYNLEKIRILSNVHKGLNKVKIINGSGF